MKNLFNFSLQLILCLLFSSTAFAQEQIKSNSFNQFKNTKQIEIEELNDIKNQHKSLITNQITRANSKSFQTVSQTITYTNNAWFNMNNLNNLGVGPFYCETTFNSNNNNTIGGKMTYMFLRRGSYNENAVAKYSDISFTARKSNITGVAFRIQSRTGQTTPNIQFRITGDSSSAIFNTKCVPAFEVI